MVSGTDTQLSMLWPNILPWLWPTPMTVNGTPSTRISLPSGSPGPSTLSSISEPTIATCAECVSSESVNERPTARSRLESEGMVHVQPRICVSVVDCVPRTTFPFPLVRCAERTAR